MYYQVKVIEWRKDPMIVSNSQPQIRQRQNFGLRTIILPEAKKANPYLAQKTKTFLEGIKFSTNDNLDVFITGIQGNKVKYNISPKLTKKQMDEFVEDFYSHRILNKLGLDEENKKIGKDSEHQFIIDGVNKSIQENEMNSAGFVQTLEQELKNLNSYVAGLLTPAKK